MGEHVPESDLPGDVGIVQLEAGSHLVTLSFHWHFPSSTSIAAAVAVKDLLFDPIANMVRLVHRIRFPLDSLTPKPFAKTSESFFTIPTARPGIDQLCRTCSMLASRPAIGSGLACAARLTGTARQEPAEPPSAECRVPSTAYRDSFPVPRQKRHFRKIRGRPVQQL